MQLLAKGIGDLATGVSASAAMASVPSANIMGVGLFDRRPISGIIVRRGAVNPIEPSHRHAQALRGKLGGGQSSAMGPLMLRWCTRYSSRIVPVLVTGIGAINVSSANDAIHSQQYYSYLRLHWIGTAGITFDLYVCAGYGAGGRRCGTGCYQTSR